MSAAQVAHVLGPQRPSVVLNGSRGHRRGRQPGARRLPPARPVPGRSSTTTAPRARSPSAPTARARSTATARLPACEQGCQLQTISFGGPSALVEAMHGTATIESFTVDGQPVPGALDAPWRAAASQVGTPTGVRAPPTARGRAPDRAVRRALVELLRRHQPDRRTGRGAGALGPDRRPRRPGCRPARRGCSRSARPAPPSRCPSAGRRAC